MPHGPWLQLNWELQHGRDIATALHSAGRSLESEPVIHKASEKRFAEWRLILTKSFPTKWQRKKSSSVGSAEILWTLFRLRGTVSRPAFLPPVLSTCTRPTPACFLPSSPCLHEAPRDPSVLSTARAVPPDFPHGLMKTHKNGREGAGSGVQTPPGWEVQTPKPVIGVTSGRWLKLRRS